MAKAWKRLLTELDIAVTGGVASHDTVTGHIGSTGTAHGVATTSVSGFMSSGDKSKLDGVATGANNYTHPTGDGNKHVPANGTSNTGKFLRASETAGSYTWATPPNATTSASGYMSNTDKSKLDGIATGANNYSHPTGDGNLHVPVTGTSNNGKVLMAGSAAGSVSWGTIANATTSANGLMSSGDKTKLDGVATGANNYTHPATHAWSMITATPNTVSGYGIQNGVSFADLTAGTLPATTGYQLGAILFHRTVAGGNTTPYILLEDGVGEH